MTENLPRSITTSMKFENGPAIGLSNRWRQGQYCSILTPIGIVGCGIYDVVVPAEFDQVLAVAQGTPDSPLVDPEDLLDAQIVRSTPRAESLGIVPGLSGREAVELMLKAANEESE
tara:strand:+ start:1819 stop:2166 length:348 start_codon:yes stop_codon:yes gene_type:complete